MPGTIGINNYLKTATFVSQETISGFAMDKAIDGRTNTQAGFDSGANRVVVIDFGSLKAISAIGIARHNAGSVGATLTFAHSATVGGTYTDFHVIEPVDNSIVWDTFNVNPDLSYITDEITARYIRLTVSGHSADLYIADLYVGEKLDLPDNTDDGLVGYEWCDNDEIITNLTYTNELVGITTLAKLPTAVLKMNNVLPSWMRTYYAGVIVALKTAPIYWRWKEYGVSAFYCWPQKNTGQPRYVEKGKYVSFEIKVEGIRE